MWLRHDCEAWDEALWASPACPDIRDFIHEIRPDARLAFALSPGDRHTHLNQPAVNENGKIMTIHILALAKPKPHQRHNAVLLSSVVFLQDSCCATIQHRVDIGLWRTLRGMREAFNAYKEQLHE